MIKFYGFVREISEKFKVYNETQEHDNHSPTQTFWSGS